MNLSAPIRIDAPFEPLVRRIVEEATVENDRVKNFRVTAKVSFVMERT